MKRGRPWALIAIAIVAVLIAASAALVARTSASVNDSAPDWVVAMSSKAAMAYSASTASGGAPQQARWALTTIGAYRLAIPDESSSKANADSPAYVVILDGKFSWTAAREGSPARSSSQLVLVIDPETRVLSSMGFLNTPIDESKLGSVKEMTL